MNDDDCVPMALTTARRSFWPSRVREHRTRLRLARPWEPRRV